MCGRLSNSIPAMIAVFALLLWADVAWGYIGPGAGFEMAGYLMGLIAMMATVFSAMIMWPIYAFLRWIRGVKDDKNPPQTTAATSATAADAVEFPNGAETPKKPEPIPSLARTSSAEGQSETGQVAP